MPKNSRDLDCLQDEWELESQYPNLKQALRHKHRGRQMGMEEEPDLDMEFRRHHKIKKLRIKVEKGL